MSDRVCQRCFHDESAHGPDGCTGVSDWGSLDCSCDEFLPYIPSPETDPDIIVFDARRSTMKASLLVMLVALVLAAAASAGRPSPPPASCTGGNCAESVCAVADSGFPYTCTLTVDIPAGTAILGAQWNWSPVHMKDRNWIWITGPDGTRYCQFSYYPGLGNTSCGVSNPAEGQWQISFESSDTRVVVDTYASWN